MNYLELINEFWKQDRFNPFENVDTKLYFMLLDESNIRKWINPIVLHTYYLEERLRIKRKAIGECRNRLKQRGLIDFVARQNQPTIYLLNNLEISNLDLISLFPGRNNWETIGKQLGNNEETIGKHINIDYKDYIDNTSVPQEELSGRSTEQPDSKPEKSEIEKVNFVFAKVKELWNTLCGPLYPKIQHLSDSRKSKVRVRLNEMGGSEKGLEIIKAIFEKMVASKFLQGDNNRGWRASFDWVFANDKNWVKIIEGKYDNHQQPQTTQPYVNFTANNGSNFEAAYAQRQQQFQQRIARKLSGGEASDADLSGLY